MTRSTAALITSVVLAISSCSDDEFRREWTDLPSDFGREIVSDATEVAATDVYRLLVGDAPSSYGPQPFRCVQLVFGDEGIGCIEVDAEEDSFPGHSSDLRSGDQRIVWRGDTTPDEPDSIVEHYVVWSSADPDGRRIEPIEASGTTNLIWVMQPGETPWGFQSIATDGSLIQAQSLVGLPGS